MAPIQIKKLVEAGYNIRKIEKEKPENKDMKRLLAEYRKHYNLSRIFFNELGAIAMGGNNFKETEIKRMNEVLSKAVADIAKTRYGIAE